jgi:quinol monooxygenase YgiN
MSETRVEMTAVITARPACGAELRGRLRELVAATVKEPGCIEFRVFEDVDSQQEDGSARFVLWEIFASPAALRTHLDTDYTRAYFAAGLVDRTQVIKQRLL